MKQPKKENQESVVEVEGKTIEEAIKEGLSILNLPREKVEIKILDEGSSGLFGLMGSKPARIQIQPKKTLANKKNIEEIISEQFSQLLKLMPIQNSSSVKINVTKEPTQHQYKVNVSIKDERDASLLIGKNGQTLNALELVLQTIINHQQHLIGEPKVVLVLDINHYRTQEEKKLKETVLEAVKTVKIKKRPYALAPMSSRTRRLVHLLLENDPDVETVSEGTGKDRHIIIKPKQ